LLALYGYGMLVKWRGNKEQWQWYKTSWIYILIGTVLAAIANVLVQYFFDKARPNLVLGLADLKHETILHKFLPASSFPSDHAAVSMAIAMSSLLRWIQKKDRKYIRFGVVLIVFSLITSFARVTTAVHWITDVIWGMIVGILVPLVLLNTSVSRRVETFAKWIGRIV
jgi:undecaprenyl-diphosphatase